jgi:hypothetical protein
MNVSPRQAASAIASFDLSRLDISWIKAFDMSRLPDKLKNRLNLGMPGYRYLSVFKYVPITKRLGV